MAFLNDTQVIQKYRQLLWLLPVVILIDMQVVNPITKNMISYITIHHSSQLLAISHHMINRCKNKLDVL